MTAIYTDEHCLDHAVPGHPERPERLQAALAGTRAVDLPFDWPKVTPADLDALSLAHAPAHVSAVRAVADRGGGWLDPDTFVVPESFAAASLAAGATVQALADVVAGRQANAAVIVRPPGHHATAARGMGFCLFNNAAVAARSVIADGAVRRVAIVDIDVHHGNGTQDIFYDNPDVLYCSTHQYPFYPGTGAFDERGHGAGMGTTINVPMMAGCGDDTYRRVTDYVLVPALRRFEPDCMILSVGFDAHWADPLASMQLSVAGYVAVLERLLATAGEICAGRVVLLLEGGYDLAVIEHGMQSATRLLAGVEPGADALGSVQGVSEPREAPDLIAYARAVHGIG